MGITTLFTDLGTALISFLQTFLPGIMKTMVDTFDAFAFTGTGDDAQMTAIFGWVVVGSVFGLGVWLIKKITHKAIGSSKV